MRCINLLLFTLTLTLQEAHQEMKFLYEYGNIVHVLQNAIDSRINSATGRRSSSQRYTSAYHSVYSTENKMLSYRRETALQGALVLAKSGRLELGDNILRTWSIFNHCDTIGLQ